MFLGGTRARYADSISGTGGFVSIRVGGPSGGLRVARVEAALSRFADAGWALQLGGQSTLLWPVGRGLWAGLAAGGALNDFEGGNASGTAAAGPLLVIPVNGSLLSAGVTGGAVRRLDSTWIGLGAASLRWQTSVLDPVIVDLGAGATAADTLRFADLSVALRAAGARVRLSAALGVRIGDLADGAWGAVEGIWAPHPHVALEATVGRYPPDLTGFAEGLYAQAGIRLFALGKSGADLPVRRRLAVWAEPREDGTVRVAVRLGRAARSVAIAGDWNGWEPVPLARQDDTWWIALRLRPGVYQYGLVADGEWTLPDGVAGMDDGFGGRVGVLVVGTGGASRQT